MPKRSLDDFPNMTFGERRDFCRAKHTRHFNKLLRQFNKLKTKIYTLEQYFYIHSATLPTEIIDGFLRRYKANPPGFPKTRRQTITE